MDLLTLPFRLPLMPLQSFIRLGEVLRDQAEQELRDPASVRRQLEQAEEAHESGEMSENDLARVQGQAVDRLLPSPAKPPARTRAHREGADQDG
jgi:gas vesicle protein GvpG